MDDALEREVESLTRGARVEARREEGRDMEDAADGEPVPESVLEEVEDDHVDLTRAEVRSRSDLAAHLRPSVFPADRAALVQCAIEEHAADALVDALRALPDDRTYRTVEEVWEAAGGRHEVREHERPHRPERLSFAFHFDRPHRLLGLPFGVTPGRTGVEVDRASRTLRATFGPWQVETPLENIASVRETGPYLFPKTAGPAHLSLGDRGLTFATNDARGVCICFRTPVRGLDPAGLVRHPALTVTVADPDGLRAVLS
jgi:Protein of unknown function (DUF2795)